MSKKSATITSTTTFICSEEYKQKISSNSYIGKKGYTILKSILDTADLEFLYKDLYMIPNKGAAPFLGGAGAELDAFPVYRENTKKIYLPRFYGIERYGRPSRDEIASNQTQVEKINIPFVKTLRDYQVEVINQYLQEVEHGKCVETRGGILQLGCGMGKCLGKNTPILMYDGTIKLVQNVKVGDQIMGDDSTPRNVLSLAHGRETMYKVHEMGDGDSSYIVNESHILSLKQGPNRKDPVVDISVKDYLHGENENGVNNVLYGYRVPIIFPEEEMLFDPYSYGKMLVGFMYREISHNYKCNSRENQLKLLAGIIDTIGTYKLGTYVISENDEKLIEDVQFVARCLGFSVKREYDNENYIKTLIIYGKGLDELPLRVQRRIHIKQKDSLNYRIRLERLPEDDYYGFEIDGNRRFVLGDFTVTHNTVMSINILSQIAKKTLIIVHKEFLLNQWIERIAEFCPKATIGRIQGPVFDIEDKDIVIGMLQTIYDRDFPENAFDSFGLTIVDEVHRIGSCQFSRALLRVQTPIMLGVTATLERKDGLTRVIHQFMGPLIYHQATQAPASRSEYEHVLVRGMEFVSNDEEFQNVATDFRGNVLFSTMITKLCAFGPRTRFLINILRDLVEENPEAQILVLGHNRSLLVNLFDAIVDQEIATVGYYLGGMKQQELDRTTERQIILATYAMASEGFDHKNLSILVMITPKTDIVQSVGRIFRTKHERPLIVDVIDPHDIFKNQWRKRLTYYRKSGYRIETISSTNYYGFQNPATVWTPVRRGGGAAHIATTTSGRNAEEISGKCFIKLDDSDLK